MSEEYKINPPMFNWLRDVYRDLHMNPELGNHEYRTTKRIQKFLDDLNIEQINMPGVHTGVVGIIRGKKPGRTLALRAEIDALPIAEKVEVPYKSRNNEVMHACGHDANTTIMLGLVKTIAETGLADRLQGNLKLIFQPAEEILNGAKSLINAGVLHNPDVDMILMSHVDPDCQVGHALLFHKVSHANSDSFEIEFYGDGGHGSRPYQTQDLIVAGAHLIEMFQTILTRELDARETGVISICSFNAGNASNVIPNYARLSGTVRTLNEVVQATIHNRMKEVSEVISELFRIKVQFNYVMGSPSSIIDEQATQILYRAASKVLSEGNIEFSQPRLGGEDFAYYSRLVPAGVMRLGCTPKGKEKWGSSHSPYFRIDELVLPLGVEIFVEAVKGYLINQDN